MPPTNGQLFENRFRAGGPTTVRGFEQNMLGPVTEALERVGLAGKERRLPGEVSGGEAERGGLACSVGADKAEALAPLDLEAQSFDRDQGAVHEPLAVLFRLPVLGDQPDLEPSRHPLPCPAFIEKLGRVLIAGGPTVFCQAPQRSQAFIKR